MKTRSEIIEAVERALSLSDASVLELLNNPTKENAEKCASMTDASIRAISELIELEK